MYLEPCNINKLVLPYKYEKCVYIFITSDKTSFFLSFYSYLRSLTSFTYNRRANTGLSCLILSILIIQFRSGEYQRLQKNEHKLSTFM